MNPEYLKELYNPQYKCEYCGKEFYYKITLELHLEEEHKQPII